MLNLGKTLVGHRELIWALAWSSICVRYKQAYLGLGWAILRPVMLMLVFTVVRSFVGIESDGLPYPLLTFTALMPWMLFQDATSEGIRSVVNNSTLIRKVYFPREVFPLTAVLTKLVEFVITASILAAMMAWYGTPPTIQMLWAPILVLYVVLIALTLCLAGAATYVYYRDVGSAMPVLLSLLMYASPIIYPLSLVRRKLVDEQIAGDWSNALFTLYTLNPLSGVIDSLQRVLLHGLPPDSAALLPGILFTLVLLPFSYVLFKRAEAYFADVI